MRWLLCTKLQTVDIFMNSRKYVTICIVERAVIYLCKKWNGEDFSTYYRLFLCVHFVSKSLSQLSIIYF